MTRKTDRAVARRAVALSHWRWTPRMRAFGTAVYDGSFEVEGAYDVYMAEDDGQPSTLHHRRVAAATSSRLIIQDPLPDLDDPATVGCVAGLARAAWKQPNAFAYYDDADGRWCIGVWDGVQNEMEFLVTESGPGWKTGTKPGRTEGEAWVVALEAAPK